MDFNIINWIICVVYRIEEIKLIKVLLGKL